MSFSGIINVARNGGFSTLPSLTKTPIKEVFMANLTLAQTCSIPGCARTPVARTYCGRHYQRWRTHGNPFQDRPTDEERFWSFVAKGPECWNWSGCKLKAGYGRFRYGIKTVSAHRFSYFLKTGHWPDSVRHDCDNPSCVNPGHLREGTLLENMADKVQRNRQYKKLSASDIAAIRRAAAEGQTYSEIGRRYGVVAGTISAIARGLSWKHVSGD